MGEVPRVIWQTWKRREAPGLLARCAASFRKWNPGWEVRFFSDADCEAYVRECGGEIADAYFGYPAGVWRADVFRILALYREGGVYADIDVECRQPLDELLASAPKSGWDVMLTTDHPVHQRAFYGGRTIFMNDLLAARPGARLLKEALEALAEQAASLRTGADGDGASPVTLTGPVFLTDVIEECGGAESAGAHVIPWERIHPLPDMSIDFPEREMYEEVILDESWKGSLDPFAVHYWHHTWCEGGDTLERFAGRLLQSDGEIAERRLQRFVPYLGKRVDTMGCAIAEFAEAGGGTLVELGVTRSFVPGGAEGVMRNERKFWHPDDPTRWDWGAGCFTRVAAEALQGLGCRYIGVDPNDDAIAIAKVVAAGMWGENVQWRRETAAAALAQIGPGAGLIYMDHAECGEQAARIHEADARVIIARGLVRPGGLVLVDDHQPAEGETPKSKYSRAVFEAAGFEVLEEGYQLLLRRPRDETMRIPRAVHFFREGADEAEGISLESWALMTSADTRWELDVWDRQAQDALVRSEFPGFFPIYEKVDNASARTAMARMLAACVLGGVIAGGRAVCLRPPDPALAGRRLVIGEGDCAGVMVAGVPAHPFWNGLEHALGAAAETGSLADGGQAFLRERVRLAPGFLARDDLPEVIGLTAIDRPDDGDPEDWADRFPGAVFARVAG